MALNIYYLDDEVDLCEIFSEYFESDDMEITTFIDATEAIEACKKKAPDVFIIDYRLADTTGVEVALAVDKAIPKILVTGELAINDSTMFNDVVLKPHHLEGIENIIDNYK